MLSFNKPTRRGAIAPSANEFDIMKRALFAAFVCTLLLAAPEAFAQQMSLPWESGLCKIAKAFTGPWLGWVAVIAIVVAAVAFAVGESNAPMSTAMRWAGGFSVAIGAPAAVGYFFPSAISSAVC